EKDAPGLECRALSLLGDSFVLGGKTREIVGIYNEDEPDVSKRYSEGDVRDNLTIVGGDNMIDDSRFEGLAEPGVVYKVRVREEN
ncbi:hypothetical protein ACFL0Y_03325, partial [Patescibacteria group bacterium]